MPGRSLRVCAVCALLPLLAACAQFQIVGTWRNPKVVEHPHFSSVVVLATVRETTTRRIFEDSFVGLARARGILATQGYTVVEESQTTTPQEVEEGVRRSGAQATIVATVIRKSVTSQTGPTYTVNGPPVWEMGFGGFYAEGWLEWSPSSTTTTMMVQLRLNVYDAASQQLAWSAITNAVSEDKLSTEIDTIAKLFFDALWSRGIIVPARS